MSTGLGEVVLYRTADGGPALDVRLERESVWLSLNQLADLFGRDKSVISRHLRNVFKEGELVRTEVVAKNATTASDGKIYQVEYFNLDARGHRHLENHGFTGSLCGALIGISLGTGVNHERHPRPGNQATRYRRRG